MSHFRGTKMYLQAFNTNTYQPMLWGSCGDQMKKDGIVKDINALNPELNRIC
jgi:hypothetical protein